MTENINRIHRCCRKSCTWKKADSFSYFPLLIKFIDAKNNLSQVHPDDEYALRVEGEYGKTEMWYVLEAEEGVYLYYGFNRDITKNEFGERIENNTILDVFNKLPVKKGDSIFVPAQDAEIKFEGTLEIIISLI